MAPKDPALPAACELDHDLSEFISKGRSDPDCPREPHAGRHGLRSGRGGDAKSSLRDRAVRRQSPGQLCELGRTAPLLWPARSQGVYLINLLLLNRLNRNAEAGRLGTGLRARGAARRPLGEVAALCRVLRCSPPAGLPKPLLVSPAPFLPARTASPLRLSSVPGRTG